MNPQKSIFWTAQARVPVFYDISGYLTDKYQRWSPRGRPWPRGQILKSLALASRPQVLKNWPVLGSRTALFFGMLKFCGAVEKFFGKRFLVEIAWKIFVKTFFFFFGEHLRFVSLVLGLEHSCPWPWPRVLCPRLHLWQIFWLYVSGSSVIRYFWIIADFMVDKKYFWA